MTEPTTTPAKEPGSSFLQWVVPTNTSWVAIAAGYAALFGLLIVPAPLALVLGVAGVVHVKRKPGRAGMGRALFAIFVGVLGTGLLVTMFLPAMFQPRPGGSGTGYGSDFGDARGLTP